MERKLTPKRKYPAFYGLIALGALSLALAGCTTISDEQFPSERALKEEVEAVSLPETLEIPDSVSQALFDPGMQASKEEEPRFDLSVQDMPAKVFFVGLVADSGKNIVAHPAIEGNITLELSDVTLPEILSVTRDVYGYEYKYSNGIYSVYPRTLTTEIFEINYIDVERRGITKTSVLIGAARSSSSASNGEGQESEETRENSSGARLETESNTDFWSDLSNTVSAIVGGEVDGRRVMVNPQAGMVVVTAMPKEVNSVRRFLQLSELSVRRQVILETKIVEVNLSEGFEAGVNWDQIKGQLLYTNNVSAFTTPAEISGTVENGELFSSIFQVVDMTRLLSLLETQGSVQVLSSPRVSTVNNQKALIRVGTDEFFVTGIKSQTTTSTAATTNSPEIELTSFFSGISLDVTPQIAENGDVILHVHPIVSDVVDQNKEIQVGNEQFSLPLALREVRESDSIVRARNGQIVVLGGLMKEKSVNANGKRPGLGDVPIVNSLFRKKSKSRQKTELVILLRPIVVDENTAKNQVEQSYKRIQSLSKEYRQWNK